MCALPRTAAQKRAKIGAVSWRRTQVNRRNVRMHVGAVAVRVDGTPIDQTVDTLAEVALLHGGQRVEIDQRLDNHGRPGNIAGHELPVGASCSTCCAKITDVAERLRNEHVMRWLVTLAVTVTMVVTVAGRARVLRGLAGTAAALSRIRSHSDRG